MVTYRLHDSMPASRRHEWEALLAIEDEREKRIQIESYLDRGYGSCYLRQPQIARLVEETLLHFDGERCRLLAWAIMPNHVHALVEVWEIPLAKLIKSWKAFSARNANELLNRTGSFWQPDYWDRFIRDEKHLQRAIRYIENNPVKAGLAQCAEEWAFSSARRSVDVLVRESPST